MKTKLPLILIATAVVVTSTAWIAPGTSPVAKSKKQTISNTANTQFSFFRVHRQGKRGIAASWGLNSNNGVTGFALEKTYEDPNDEYATWEPVTAFPCGNERSYKHSDENVSAGIITYRVTAFAGGNPVAIQHADIQIVAH